LTDTQILTLIIGITFPVLGLAGTIAALMYSNKRLDDLSGATTKQINAFEKATQQRFDDFEKHLTQKLDNGFEHIELLLKLHVAEHHK
jgi:hypothetical protein